MSITDLEKLIEEEINKISQEELVSTIQDHKVAIRVENREWDYSNTYKEYPCYIVLEDKKSNTAIAYCENGFGPAYPWGLLFIEGEYMSMGMDANWFCSLEEAVRDSKFWEGENPKGYEVN